MELSRRSVLTSMAAAVLAGALPAVARADTGAPGLWVDFGGATAPAPGYVRVGTETYSAQRGYGWVSAAGLSTRDRGGDPIHRDFVFGTAARTFRIGNLAPGRYRLAVVAGDLTFGDHITQVQAPGVDGGTLPELSPSLAQFGTVTGTLVVPAGASTVDVTFGSPINNWVVNAITLEPVPVAETPRVAYVNAAIASTWGPILTSPDPTVALLAGHRARAAGRTVASTDLAHADYLRLIGSGIDFWTSWQSPAGAIIDPYRNSEFQYSTPAFAHAAAALVAYAGRADLVDAAARALDHSTRTLADRTAASAHEDFFPPMIAHAIRLLAPHVPAARAAVWRADIDRFEPFRTYRAGVGGNNWNLVAATGEALFQMDGLRDAHHRFAEASFAGQGDTFDPVLGLYLEGPLAYDHFPRLWAGDLIARGYAGPYAAELTESMRRASIVSLFMQSPTGELPAGGRSAHHQWNEAEQCVTYEIFAARALAAGDAELAGWFTRAAHLALGSMFRWVRPSGEMQIVKNWMDPAERVGYESYSAHSQYNLLPLSMLAIAYEHASSTVQVAEAPSPADVGGFVLPIDPLHKVFANAGGTYVEIDTAADHHYDATGLIRAHFAGHSPQLGSSDSLVTAPSYVLPAGAVTAPTTGIGVAWQTSPGTWRYFGELAPDLTEDAVLQRGTESAEEVTFALRYNGSFGGGVTAVEERFTLTPEDVRVTTVLPGYTGPVRRVAPVLSHDGRTPATIVVDGEEARVWQEEDGTSTSTLVYRMHDAETVQVGAAQYGNHNGLMRLAVGEYAAGAGADGVTLTISAHRDVTVTVTTRSVAGTVHLVVRTRNNADVPVDVRVTTPYGTRTLTGVAPGRTVATTFATRAASIPAGLVDVVATTADGTTATVTEAYEAHTSR
ncbi:hypothetical protein [Georgenia faecalis]|uniref:Uncharacterized protein n=1 Tax=Georgenia faecalis TaxID=2483799 RepID=A0ABV9D839_9MICO|nr:hypothetical protein [Georgenia faecalis]